MPNEMNNVNDEVMEMPEMDDSALNAEIDAIYADDSDSYSWASEDMEDPSAEDEEAEASETDAEEESEDEPEEEPVDSEADEDNETDEEVQEIDESADSEDVLSPSDDDAEQNQQADAQYLTIAYGDQSARVNAEAVSDIASQLGMDTASVVQIFSDASSYRQAAGALNALQDFAEANNTDIDGAAKLLDDKLYDSILSPIADQLREKYAHSDPAIIDSMARQQADKRISEIRANRKQIAVSDPQKANEERIISRWRSAFNLFPDLKPDTVPKTVMDACDRGADPVEELYRYNLSEAKKRTGELERELKVAKKNLKNRKASPGPMKGERASKTLEEEIDDIYRS